MELADHGSGFDAPNAVKWFMLFATKRKWRENSRLEDIEGGLDWVQRNIQAQRIESLAMPTLRIRRLRLEECRTIDVQIPTRYWY